MCHLSSLRSRTGGPRPSTGRPTYSFTPARPAPDWRAWAGPSFKVPQDVSEISHTTTTLACPQPDCGHAGRPHEFAEDGVNGETECPSCGHRAPHQAFVDAFSEFQTGGSRCQE